MALDIASKYPGKSAPASPEYPLGSARNITIPGDGLGTPLEEAWLNDLFGLQQSLLSDVGIVPTGAPDKVGSSQYFEAILLIIANSFGVLTGRNLGIETGNDAATNTAAMVAAQAIAISSGRPIFLTPGVYLINEFTMGGGVKILTLGSGIITFESEDLTIIRLASGVVHNGTEFHGKLKSNSTLPSTYRGLILAEGNATEYYNVNFDDCVLECLSAGGNGITIVIGNSGNNEHSRMKNFSAMRCTYYTGRMGIEILNQTPWPVITNASIATEAVFTVDEINAYDGMSVMLVDMIGSSEIENLNEEYFEVSDLTATTFKLKRTDGTYIDTSGGTYTSGGEVRVFRGEDINLQDSNFIKTGQVTNIGMGFSGDNSLLNVDLSGSVCEDNAYSGIENVGCCSSKFNNIIFRRATGQNLAMSNKTGYDNIIDGCISEGFAEDRMLISKQKRMTFVNNNLSSTKPAEFSNVYDSKVLNNSIRSIGTYAAIFDNSGQNVINENTFDNSLSANNFSCLRFFNAESTGNQAFRNTLLKGVGGVAWDQAGGAAGNENRDYRTNINDEFIKNRYISPTPNNTTYGNVNDWPILPFTIERALDRSTGLAGVTKYTIKMLKSAGAQEFANIKFAWCGRLNNNPLNGEFAVSFGTAGQYDSAPAFYQMGGVVTLAAVQYDGSGYPFWDVILPTNNGRVNTVIRAVMNDSGAASLFEINETT